MSTMFALDVSPRSDHTHTRGEGHTTTRTLVRPMKVSELIELLSDMDPDASVYVMGPKEYPFEYALSGIAAREDFVDYGDEDPDDDAGDGESRSLDRWSATDDQLPRTDVFILQGSQLRYGNRAAWDGCR